MGLSPEEYSVLSVPTYDLILMALDSPKSCMRISREIGSPVSTTYTDLQKLIRAGLVEKDAAKRYSLTREGKEYAELAEKVKKIGFLDLMKRGGITKDRDEAGDKAEKKEAPKNE